MKVLICGGRDWTDSERLYRALDRLAEKWPADTTIIHGGAGGVDRMAGAWAKRRGMTVQVFKAPWDDLKHHDSIVRQHPDGRKYNVNAGPMRNQQMLDEGKPDLVLAFPGGNGTADMVSRAKSAGVRVVGLVAA